MIASAKTQLEKTIKIITKLSITDFTQAQLFIITTIFSYLRNYPVVLCKKGFLGLNI